MSVGQDAALRKSGALIASGLVVELVSFTVIHPMAFIGFAVLGGGLMAAGMLLFVVSTRTGSS